MKNAALPGLACQCAAELRLSYCASQVADALADGIADRSGLEIRRRVCILL